MQQLYSKQILLDRLATDTNNPTNQKIRQWIGKKVNVKSFLYYMQKEGLIKIEMVHEGNTVHRVITPLVTKILI